jgi:hypothetical protein
LEIRARPGSLLEQEQQKIPVLLLCSRTRLTEQREQKSNPCAVCCAHTRINQREMGTLTELHNEENNLSDLGKIRSKQEAYE